VRHDADDSSEQKHRRQWDDQDVDHLLNVLDNTELSSSCSTSRTSCSGSVSQTSCVTDDAIDTAAAATQHLSDRQGVFPGIDCVATAVDVLRFTLSASSLNVYFGS